MQLLEADPRFHQVALVAEANGVDVAVVLREGDALVRAARIARARVIAAEQRKAAGK